MMKSKIQLNTEVLKFHSNLALHYIQIPDELVLSMANSFPFRVFCTINNHRFPAAIVKHGIDGFIIQMGNQTIKSAKVIVGDQIEILLERDDTEHGYEMPEEMIELLLQDEDGRKAWDSLTKGAQRSFLYYLSTGKSQETRIKRSILILKRAQEIIAEKTKKARAKATP
jgi:hypothetical protein